MYRLPKNPDIRRKWISATESVTPGGSRQTFTARAVVCSEHFSQADYRTTGRYRTMATTVILNRFRYASSMPSKTATSRSSRGWRRGDLVRITTAGHSCEKSSRWQQENENATRALPEALPYKQAARTPTRARSDCPQAQSPYVLNENRALKLRLPRPAADQLGSSSVARKYSNAEKHFAKTLRYYSPAKRHTNLPGKP